jgi:hypothetical protein
VLVVVAATWWGLTLLGAQAAPSPRDELDDLVAEARRLGSRNGANHATEVLAALDASIAEAQSHLAAGQATAGLRATERARALIRLASATIARGKAEREATELHASADARTEEATIAERQALVMEAELAQVEAGLSQPTAPAPAPAPAPAADLSSPPVPAVRAAEPGLPAASDTGLAPVARPLAQPVPPPAFNAPAATETSKP